MQNRTEKKAVVVGLSGGLGNQMFQYAAGRALALRLGVPLRVDLSWFICQKARTYALASLAIEAGTCDAETFVPGFLRIPWDRTIRRIAWKRMGLPVFRERHFHFDPAIKSLGHPAYLDGYWQSELYFSECRDVLLREFCLRDRPPEASRAVADRIASAEAVCVHVRRGDYVSDKLTAEVHGLCTMEYYEKGISLVTQGLKNTHCFVFSDDPAWVRSHFAFEIPMTVVDVNTTADAHWDLHLMSLCRHFVIANSSLSWWGAWLGADPAKRVVAPARWFRNSRNDTRDLVPGSWMRV